MRHLYILIVCALWGFPLQAQTPFTPSTTAMQCGCGVSAFTTATVNSTEAEMRRGIPAFIVLRGQRFGGAFSDNIGAGGGYNVGLGGDIPHYPNQFGPTAFGGGISPQTANIYGALIGPFKAGFPTVATVVAEIVDVFGDVVTTATTTHATLELGNIRSALRGKQWIFPQRNTMTTATHGRLEWGEVQIDGIAGTTLTLTVRHSTLATCGCAVQVSLQGGFPVFATFATQNTNSSVTERLYLGAKGPFATPGVVGTGKFSGSVPYIIVGTPVYFPYQFPDYSNIAVIITDRFGNFASFSTDATIYLSGGNPPISQVTTPIIGNVATSIVMWGLGNRGQEINSNVYSSYGYLLQYPASAALPGIARTVADLNQVALGTHIPLTLPPYSTGEASTNNAGTVSPAIGSNGVGYPPINNPQLFNNVVMFPNFQVWGATSSNVKLQVLLRPWLEGSKYDTLTVTTSAIVDLMPGDAIGIMPVLIPDKYDSNRLKRMPSRFVIGQSNANDSSTWFYLQAVDKYGNRVDRGENLYSNGVANITFYTPEEGLPRAGGAISNGQYPPNGFQFTQPNPYMKPSNQSSPPDPNVKANNQKYSATGTSAIAVNGLYTFDNFTPLGPPSLEPMGNDVVLTFEDLDLGGMRRCRHIGCVRPTIELMLPPVTTATTTFLAPTSVQVLSTTQNRGKKISISPNPAGASNEAPSVHFTLPETADVRIEVSSLQGTQVMSIHAGLMPSGEQRVSLPVAQLSSGVYAVRLVAGGMVRVAMMTVVR